MVYYFTSSIVNPPAQIYVGKDKFESAHPLLPPPRPEETFLDVYVQMRI